MRRRSTVRFLMCLPLIVIITGLVIYPAFYSIYLSMLNRAQTHSSGSAITGFCCHATCSGWCGAIGDLCLSAVLFKR